MIHRNNIKVKYPVRYDGNSIWLDDSYCESDEFKKKLKEKHAFVLKQIKKD